MRQTPRALSKLTVRLLVLLLAFFVIGRLASAQDSPQTAPPAAPQAAPQTQHPAAGPSAQPKAADVPPPKIVLDNNQVAGILGKDVQSAAKEDMGHIIDVIVDSAGVTRAAIIDFGGFLGVGSRKIAVDWNALHFGMVKGKEQITLDLTKDQVKAAPEFHEGKPIVVLGALSAADEFGARLGTNTGKPNAPPPTPSTPER
jgi:hypothetical protein